MNRGVRTHSTTSVVTAADRTTTCCAKLEDYESGKDPIINLSSIPYSSFNEGESSISDKEQKKITTQGERHKPRFDSLRLKLRKITSSFKKQKDKRSSHNAILALEYRNETSDESSIETISSTDTTYSPSKRTKSLKVNRHAESLLQSSLKAENFSLTSNQAGQNLAQTVIVKSLAPTSKDEADSIFTRQLNVPTEIAVGDNQSSRNQSSLSSTDPLDIFRLSFSALRMKLPLIGLKRSGNTILPTSSNKSCDLRLSEDVKSSISYLEDSGNSPVDTSWPTFSTENSVKSKSASDVDKSLTMSSHFQERLPSSQSYSYFWAKSSRTSLNEGKNSEILYSSNEILQCVASKVTSANLNRCPRPLMTSSIRSSKSSTRCELNASYHSSSFSKETLLCSPLGSSSPSSRSLSTFPRSLLEFPLLEKIKINSSNTEDENLTDAQNLLIVSSGLSDDFDVLDMRSSSDSTDSESVSSSEFLPCSYCRFVIHNASISGSVVPYERLE